jgi:hypothetical protein
MRLLALKYAEGDFQRIPAKHGGDFGIECFVRSQGYAYQCYAASEPAETKKLYEAQRDKITEDIRKFCVNKAELGSIFGLLKIKCWILVVPKFESAHLVGHAATKAKEVQSHNLTYCTTDFTINVCDDTPWTLEAAKLKSAGHRKLTVEPEEPTKTTTDEWGQQNTISVARLKRKAKSLTLNVDAFSRAMVRKHILGRNMYDSIQTSYPDIYQEIQRIKSVLEKRLDGLNYEFDNTKTYLQWVKSQLREQLTASFQNFTLDTIETLVDEAIADWLLRCPLQFEEPQHGSA